MEIHQDVIVAPGEVEAGAGIIVEFEIWHTVGEFGGFGGVGFNFV